MSRSLLILLIFTLSVPAVQAQNAAFWVNSGNALLAEGKTAKAMKDFDQAVELDQSANSYSARAQASYLSGKMDNFLLDVSAALKADSMHVKANYQRALYAFRAREWKVAEKHCTVALDEGAQGALRGKTLIIRGEARAEIANFIDAKEDLEKGIDLVDEDLEAEIMLASVYSRLNEHESAVKQLTQLTNKMPDLTEHWVNLGYELAQMKHYEEALKAYEQALELDKDEPITLSNQAYSLLQLGRQEEALKCVNKSIRSQRNNPYALRTRALIYLKKGDRSNACEDLYLARQLGELEEVNKLILENCSGMR